MGFIFYSGVMEHRHRCGKACSNLTHILTEVNGLWVNLNLSNHLLMKTGSALNTLDVHCGVIKIDNRFL